MARNDNRKRGAAPRSNPRNTTKRWPFFAGGLATGILAAGGVYLANILPTAMELREKDAQRQAECAPTGQSPTGMTPRKPGQDPATPNAKKPVTFEFYSILPQQEVVAPVTGNRTTVAPAAKPEPSTSASAETSGQEPVSRNTGRYQLQAGSFRTQAEADRRRAELVLSGYSVSIQPVNAGNGEHWFRVMVGPFSGEDAMQQARQQLSANRIDTLPIRMK